MEKAAALAAGLAFRKSLIGLRNFDDPNKTRALPCDDQIKRSRETRGFYGFCEDEGKTRGVNDGKPLAG